MDQIADILDFIVAHKELFIGGSCITILVISVAGIIMLEG